MSTANSFESQLVDQFTFKSYRKDWQSSYCNAFNDDSATSDLDKAS